MRWSLWFVRAVYTLEFAATFAYLYQRQWKLALIWGAVAVANVGMSLLDEV